MPGTDLPASALILLLLLAGCARERAPDPLAEAKSAYRDQFFFECLKNLPAGPQATKYNDWDEVVRECSSQSWYHMNTRFQ